MTALLRHHCYRYQAIHAACQPGLREAEEQEEEIDVKLIELDISFLWRYAGAGCLAQEFESPG